MSDVKILITGWGRSGKDAAGAILHRLGLRYGGSTSWAAKELMAEHLGVPAQLAWEERHQNREAWKSHCDFLRRNNPLFLIERALSGGANVITGVRGLPEIQAAVDAKLFDHILWIHRPGVPPDFTVDYGPEFATEVIHNSGTLDDFRVTLRNWVVQAIDFMEIAK